MIHLLWSPFYIFTIGVSFCVAYYWFFALILLLKTRTPIAEMDPTKKLTILVPAHNEELVIAATMDSLKQLNYPSHLYRIVVIADNCSDKTPEIVRSKGIELLERRDETRKGKGYGLHWAFGQIASEDFDAVVVIDADTTVDSGFLRVMNNYLCAGYRVVQGYNNISNPNENPLTQLMFVTNILKNRLFNESKQRLGLSVSLMGTGMCFDKMIIEEFGWDAFSIGEDWEYSAMLADKGVRVGFACGAVTYSEEAHSVRQAFNQRIRWARGKMEVSYKYVLRSFTQSIRRLDLRKADAALNILTPNYSLLANLTIAQLMIGLLYPDNVYKLAFLSWGITLLLLQIMYLALGVFFSIAVLSRPFTVLLIGPLFLAWKLMVDLLALLGLRKNIWSRTNRNPTGKLPR